MRNKNFLDRQQLENIIEGQKQEIDRLTNSNKSWEVFYGSYIFTVFILTISGVIVILEKFKGYEFVVFSIFLANGIFISLLINRYFNMKKDEYYEYKKNNLLIAEQCVTPLKYKSIETLKEDLRIALDKEDYSLATEIRDELKIRTNEK